MKGWGREEEGRVGVVMGGADLEMEITRRGSGRGGEAEGEGGRELGGE